MVLSPTANGGGAWVGLVGRKDELISFNNRNDQSDGNTSVGGILLYGWAFDAKQKHVYNRHVATSSSQPGQPQQQERRRDVGCCLEGSYRVAWPIHLIVTQNALSQYNAVFQFLFSVGRISSLLRGAWALLMASKSQTKSLMHASRLRSRMAFLVDTLQYYFHVDVIAAQWHCLNEILEETKTTHDFEKVQTLKEKINELRSSKGILGYLFAGKKIVQIKDDLFDLVGFEIASNNGSIVVESIEKLIKKATDFYVPLIDGFDDELHLIPDVLDIDNTDDYSSKMSDSLMYLHNLIEKNKIPFLGDDEAVITVLTEAESREADFFETFQRLRQTSREIEHKFELNSYSYLLEKKEIENYVCVEKLQGVV
jgi:hypothetical protein